jgi:hypothetical protein
MLTINPKYITDQEGKKLSVVLSIEEFESMVEHLEDLEDVRLYDQVKESNEPSLPLDKAFELIESLRKGK